MDEVENALSDGGCEKFRAMALLRCEDLILDSAVEQLPTNTCPSNQRDKSLGCVSPRKAEMLVIPVNAGITRNLLLARRTVWSSPIGRHLWVRRSWVLNLKRLAHKRPVSERAKLQIQWGSEAQCTNRFPPLHQWVPVFVSRPNGTPPALVPATRNRSQGSSKNAASNISYRFIALCAAGKTAAKNSISYYCLDSFSFAWP